MLKRLKYILDSEKRFYLAKIRKVITDECIEIRSDESDNLIFQIYKDKFIAYKRYDGIEEYAISLGLDYIEYLSESELELVKEDL